MPNKTGMPRTADWAPRWVETGQQWAEVNFVPDWIAYSKKNPEYRFIAIREPLSEQPCREWNCSWNCPSPCEAGRRSLAQGLRVGDQPTFREMRRSGGTGRDAVKASRSTRLKSDLAAGRLPSGLFGANAAWWAIAVLAFNELCDEAAGVGRTP